MLMYPDVSCVYPADLVGIRQNTPEYNQDTTRHTYPHLDPSPHQDTYAIECILAGIQRLAQDTHRIHRIHAGYSVLEDTRMIHQDTSGYVRIQI